MKYIFLIFMIFFCSWSSFIYAEGGVYGYGYAQMPCGEGSINVTPMPIANICNWKDKNQPVMYGPGQVYSTNYAVLAGYDNSYPPFTAKYKLATYICYVSTSQYCSIGNSVQKLESINSVLLNSSQPIAMQEPNFGGISGNWAAQNASAPCWAMIDESGIAWRGSNDDGRQCQDAHAFPSVPSVCYINYGDDLNVDLGTLERVKIATVPVSGDSGNIKKSISVLCTRDAGTTVITKFKFTPINVDGNNIVSTSSQGLGVAIIYKGKVVNPADEFREDYQAGYSNIDLEFVTVRDPNINIKDIPTGDFTAHAAMIMSEL